MDFDSHNIGRIEGMDGMKGNIGSSQSNHLAQFEQKRMQELDRIDEKRMQELDRIDEKRMQDLYKIELERLDKLHRMEQKRLYWELSDRYRIGS